MARRKRKSRFQRRTLPGAVPGSIVVDPQARRPKIHVLAYGPEQFEERTVTRAREVREIVDRLPITWINVEGLGDADTINEIGELFDLHRLALEDVVNVHQRAKVEEYRDHLFIVARMPRKEPHLDTEQLSIFLGENFVVTFLEDPGDCFEPVRQRLRSAQGQSRGLGPDYLAYALLDAVVDAYFPVLEHYGERLDTLEDKMLVKPNPQTVTELHAAKSVLRALRRVLWPLREALNVLVRDRSALIRDETRVYLRDCYDHTVQLIDLLEVDRERCADLLDLYLSQASNRLNEVMRVLTVISTLFIPLTFVVGIYGMNFNPLKSPWNMPELEWYYGYPAVLLLMALIAAGQFAFFFRKGWLGSSLARDNRREAGSDSDLDGNGANGNGQAARAAASAPSHQP